MAETLALAGEWKRLDRVATAAAIVLSPVFFALLYGTAELQLWVSLALSVLAVAAFRGFVDVVAHLFIPAPSLYVDGVDNVIAYLPPAPPDAKTSAEQQKLRKAFRSPATAEAAAEGAGGALPAMMFQSGDMEGPLNTPLVNTPPFDALPPRPSTMSQDEVDVFSAVAQLNAFDTSVISDQTGAGFLVLDRLNQAEAAQEQVRSTLKA